MPQSTKKVRVVNKETPKKTIRPALTPEAEENQMISLAFDLAKQQLIDGTASSQVITHFLQLGSSKKKQETEIKELEKELLIAKTQNLKAAQASEELYAKVIKAMMVYSGNSQEDDEDDYR